MIVRTAPKRSSQKPILFGEYADVHTGLSPADRCRMYEGQFWVGERQQPHANDVQMSIRSAMG